MEPVVVVEKDAIVVASPAELGNMNIMDSVMVGFVDMDIEYILEVTSDMQTLVERNVGEDMGNVGFDNIVVVEVGAGYCLEDRQ